MNSYTETAEKIQEQILTGIKELHASNLEMAANFSKTAGAAMPKTASLPAGYNPTQYIEQGFKFTNNVLDLQKAYLLRLSETLKPLATAAATAPEKATKAV